MRASKALNTPTAVSYLSLIFQQYKLDLINKHDMRNTWLHISESHRTHWEHSGILRNHLRDRVGKPFQSDMMVMRAETSLLTNCLTLKHLVKYRICFGLSAATVHWSLQVYHSKDHFTRLCFFKIKHPKIFNVLQDIEVKSYEVCKCHRTVMRRLHTKAPHFSSTPTSCSHELCCQGHVTHLSHSDSHGGCPPTEAEQMEKQRENHLCRSCMFVTAGKFFPQLSRSQHRSQEFCVRVLLIEKRGISSGSGSGTVPCYTSSETVASSSFLTG